MSWPSWALPGAATATYPSAIQEDGRSSIDKAVLEAVNIRLGDTLHLLFPGQKRILDDDSSDNYELRIGLEHVLRCART